MNLGEMILLFECCIFTHFALTVSSLVFSALFMLSDSFDFMGFLPFVSIGFFPFDSIGFFSFDSIDFLSFVLVLNFFLVLSTLLDEQDADLLAILIFSVFSMKVRSGSFFFFFV